MNQKARIGIVAVGIVVGATVIGGIAVGGLLVAAGGKKINAAKVNSPAASEKPATTNESPISRSIFANLDQKSVEEYTKQQFEYARRHAWWHKALSPAHLDGMIAKIIATNSGHWAAIGQNGEMSISEDQLHYHAGIHQVSEGWDKSRTAFIEISGGKRPERLFVIRDLIDELDRLEFKHGPGR